MLHKGSRIDGADYFDDYATKGGGGILGGLGQDDFEDIGQTLTTDGLAVTMSCRACGKRAVITLEYEELYVVGTNGPGLGLLLPAGWMYSPNNAMAYPANIPCAKCGEKLCPQVSPGEARTLVNDGLSRGWVNPQLAQMWQQRVMQMRAAQGG